MTHLEKGKVDESLISSNVKSLRTKIRLKAVKPLKNHKWVRFLKGMNRISQLVLRQISLEVIRKILDRELLIIAKYAER